MTRTIVLQRIPARDPRLGRHVHHDSLSRRFPFSTRGLPIQDVRWHRRVPVFDQGNLGSCTGNAGLGCTCTDPLFDTVPQPSPYSEDEPGAVKLYSDATAADPYAGQYPPDDTGSDGLTIAKVLKAAGVISGYTWTFSLVDAIKALGTQPLITGIPWFDDMFSPSAEGFVKPTGALAGGHEIVVDEYDSARSAVGFTNSWGSGWGLAGRFYMAAEDWGKLLDQQGDVTAFVPVTVPPPDPDPNPVLKADDALMRALLRDDWVHGHHHGGSQVVATAGLGWLKAHGRYGA